MPAKSPEKALIDGVLSQFEQKRKDAKAQFEQVMVTINGQEEQARADLERIFNAISESVNGVASTEVEQTEATSDANGNGSTGSKRRKPRRKGRKAYKRSNTTGYQLSVKDDKYQEIIAFLRQHPEGVRQSDIAKALKLNSGTVSVAMKIATEKGEAKHAGKQDRANVYKPEGKKVGKPTSKASSEDGKGRGRQPQAA